MDEIISYKMCAVKVRNSKLRNYLNCTAVQLMIFSKQTKWRKGILNTNVI